LNHYGIFLITDENHVKCH